MNSSSSIFYEKSTNKLLLKFAVPSIISLLVGELYNMVDTLYVGRTIGPMAVGGLTVAFPIQRLIIALGLMVAVGVYTSVARHLGEKNEEEIKNSITNSISLIISIILALTFFIYIFRDKIILNLGASRSIFPYAKDYISIVIFGGIFQCLTVVYCHIMTALGDTRINLKATSLGAIANIIIDYILVVHFNLGVKGAAIATVVSQMGSFVYAYYYFNKKVRTRFNLKFQFTLEKAIVGSIVSVGFSTFIIEISDAIVAFILNNLLLTYGGEESVIIFGLVTRVSMFLFITLIGISSAMQPIAAFNFGREDYKKVKDVVISTIKIAVISSLICWVGMFIFSQNIMSLFVNESAILYDAAKIFRIVILVFPIVSVYYVAIYYYQAMGEAKSSFLLSIFRQIVVFIPLLLILMQMFGTLGAWIAYPLSDIISGLTGIFFVKRGLDIEDEDDTFDYEVNEA